MSISAQTKRLLLARSGGFCSNPSCNTDLFTFFKKGEISNIEELAHIIGQSNDGPRGKNTLSENERDQYDNIIVLCPTCHTRVDKHPDQYPNDVLLSWKKEHAERIASLFQAPKLPDRKAVRIELSKLLLTNKTVFDTYGPYSNLAKENGWDTEAMWEKRSIDTIIPNNRKIQSLIEVNYSFLNEDEQVIFEKWKQHKDSFEYNKLSGDRTAALTIYPVEFNQLLYDKN